MRESEITTPEDLDAALHENARRKYAKLWKAAQGRSFRWIEALGLLVASLMIFNGLVAFSEQSNAAIQIAIGLALLLTFLISRVQAQVNALAELVKKLEEKAPRA